jgi:transcriptional regulator with XRE-family HTH domain
MGLPGPQRGGTPRHVFGAVLRYYRERAGLSRSELAARVHKSVSLIQAIELGERVATEDVTADLEAVPELHTDGILAVLRGQFADSLNYQALPAWFQDWASSERVATRLRWFEPLLVPGLLQTEAYARALLTDRIGSNGADIDERVAARLERQAILAREVDPAELWAVIDEPVLRRPVGGPKVMADQVSRLIEASHQPNVVIQVIPAATAVHDGLAGAGFAVAEFEDSPPVGYQETALRGQPIEGHKDISALVLTWDRLRAEALPRADSLALLEEAATTWTNAA